MKRLILLFFILAPMWANAQTMCVRDKSLVISLVSGIQGTGYGHNPSEWIWWVDFPYGRIYGDATCLSAEEGLGRTTGQGAYYGTDDYAKTPITAEAGLSGTDANGNDRKYCWCRATHPVSSLWVLQSGMTDANTCITNCSLYCPYFFRGEQSKLQKSIFSSIGL